MMNCGGLSGSKVFRFYKYNNNTFDFQCNFDTIQCTTYWSARQIELSEMRLNLMGKWKIKL